MPTLLSDPPFAVYLAFVLAAIVCGAVWINRRTSKALLVFATSLLLLGGLFLLDRLFESPREEAKRRVEAMAKAADARDVDAFLANVADTFQYQGESEAHRTVTREELRRSGLWSVLRQYNVHVATWDFDRNDVVEIDPITVEIGFLGKGEADGKQAPMYFRARFTRQSDGTMKLTALSSYDALKRTNERKSIPNFP